MNLINNNNVRKTSQYNWLVSPYYFINSANATERVMSSSGSVSNYIVYNTRGGRPVIVLKPSRTAISGEGTLSSPYVIN